MAITKKPKYPRLCKQGKTYTDGFLYNDEFGNPVDYSDYIARIEIRSSFPDEDSETNDDDVLITLTTENGGITIDGNRVLIRIESNVTSTFPIGTYYWELELVSSDDPPYIPYLMEPSTFKVTGEVTL
jgi:hypothetical protein